MVLRVASGRGAWAAGVPFLPVASACRDLEEKGHVWLQKGDPPARPH